MRRWPPSLDGVVSAPFTGDVPLRAHQERRDTPNEERPARQKSCLTARSLCHRGDLFAENEQRDLAGKRERRAPHVGWPLLAPRASPALATKHS